MTVNGDGPPRVVYRGGLSCSGVNPTRSSEDDVATDHETDGETYTNGLACYVRDNPLAMVAGAMILGMLLARFAFLGNSKDAD